MKKALVGPLALLLVCCGAFRAEAQDLSQEEKDRALEYLESTKKGVLDATKGLSEAQWNFKPAPDRWSVAEVLEHIAAAEDMLRGMTQEQVMKSTAVPLRDAAETKKADEAVLAMVPDRSHKAQAPEPLRPTNRFGFASRCTKAFCADPGHDRGIFEEHPGLAHALGRQPLGKIGRL